VSYDRSGITLDDLTDGTWLVENQPIIIYYGGEDLPGSEYEMIFKGRVKRLESWDNSTLTLSVQDLTEDLYKSEINPNVIDAATYPNAGANTDKPKPFGVGYCKFVKPLLIDTSTNTYMFHDNTTVAYTALYSVYVDGASVSFTDNTNGTFTLSSAPTGTVTCDFAGAWGLVPALGTEVSNLLTTFGGLTAGDIDSTYITNLNTALPYSPGYWFSKPTDVLTAIDTLASGWPIWYGFTRDGIFRIAEFTIPTGSADHDLTEAEILRDSFSARPVGDVLYKQRIGYAHVFNPIPEGQQAGTVAYATRLLQAEAWQYISLTNAATLTDFPLATFGGDIFCYVWINTTHVNWLVYKHLMLRCAYFREITLQVKFLDFEFELGDSVSITWTTDMGYNRFNLSSSLFRITEIAEDYDTNTITLKLWG
jgi:hypothetical protein